MADQINQMNKLLDPSSTFREGEADLSKNTQKEDLALIYSLMKMLDPSSPLREGETKQMNSKGNEFDVAKSVNSQLPFFACSNRILKNQHQKDKY